MNRVWKNILISWRGYTDFISWLNLRWRLMEKKSILHLVSTLILSTCLFCHKILASSLTLSSCLNYIRSLYQQMNSHTIRNYYAIPRYLQGEACW